jgi:hypothetical protein
MFDKLIDTVKNRLAEAREGQLKRARELLARRLLVLVAPIHLDGIAFRNPDPRHLGTFDAALYYLDPEHEGEGIVLTKIGDDLYQLSLVKVEEEDGAKVEPKPDPRTTSDIPKAAEFIKGLGYSQRMDLWVCVRRDTPWTPFGGPDYSVNGSDHGPVLYHASGWNCRLGAVPMPAFDGLPGAERVTHPSPEPTTPQEPTTKAPMTKCAQYLSCAECPAAKDRALCTRWMVEAYWEGQEKATGTKCSEYESCDEFPADVESSRCLEMQEADSPFPR